MLYGIVSFDEPIYFATNALGSTTPVVIGEASGSLITPSLPNTKQVAEDMWVGSLLPPDEAKKWKRGSEAIRWGDVDIPPMRFGRVRTILLKFEVPNGEPADFHSKIRSDFPRWRNAFIGCMELITRQRQNLELSASDFGADLELLHLNPDGKLQRVHVGGTQLLSVSIIAASQCLSIGQLETICGFVSSGRSMAPEYRIQLEAFRALRGGDYRKAIIEAAVASEIALTRAIKQKLEEDNISYSEKLLSKFRMLGGRLELAQAIGVDLPSNVDLKSCLVEPRNGVIHRAEFSTREIAQKAIDATGTLLSLVTPCFLSQ